MLRHDRGEHTCQLRTAILIKSSQKNINRQEQ